MTPPRAVLFDIDGTLISTGGAGARSWRYAFQELHGIPADIGEFTDAGMTDPIVARLTFGAVEAAAHIKLARAGFNRYFPFGGYGSDSGDRVELTKRAIERGGQLVGEEIDPSQVFVVGDTPKDISAAHGAGCVAVATATGHYGRDELEATGAEYV